MSNREIAIEAAACEGFKKMVSGEIDSMEAFNRFVADMVGEKAPNPTKDELSEAYDIAHKAWSADLVRQEGSILRA